MKIKVILSGLALAAFFSGAWVMLTPGAQPAPDVTFTTLDGKRIELQALKGKPVIVTFWATDCPGCIEEVPQLIDLYRQYHPQGLEIIAVAMYYDPPNHVLAMTRAKGIPYAVALDLQARHAKAFGDVRLTPIHFVIAPDGRIVLQKTGVFELDAMKALIESLVGL
ncbi:MAG: thioredoxin [Gammaproteobacteria bacterium HGW-Gammaproteobacteria-3]|nr:MAG: thioredoxin [Gammaproteobacteria bacterium HGW-Gammaproteobacteria-3]